MPTTRRTLLGSGLLLGTGGTLLAGCSDDRSPGPASPSATGSAPSGATDATGAAGAATPTIPDFDPGDWESVRAQFPLDRDSAQLAAFVLSPHTAQVSAAVAFHRSRLEGDTEAALVAGLQLEDEARSSAAAYAGTAPGSIALTGSTTEGIAIMYGGVRLGSGDEVLTTTHDFYSTEESLRLLELRTGAEVRRTSLYDDPSTATRDEMVSRLVAAVTPRTRVVALTWVHSSTGVRVPVREICDALAGRGVRVCVDGVHGFAAVDVDLPDLGCDFLAAGTHKWLFGPRGTGILWGRDWEPLTALVPSFSGQQAGARLSPGGYHAFEHRWAVSEAFAFHQRIGRTEVVTRTVEQATRLKEGLAGVDGITVVTPASPEVSAGIVCVDVRGVRPPDAVQALRTLGVVASATPYATSYLRFGPSIVTTPEECDRAVEAVATLV